MKKSIKQITINNFLKIDHLDIKPGKVTLITGGNAVGKTSAVKAILNVFEGGFEAELRRTGTDKTETVIVLDDNTEFRKTATAKTVTLKHKDPKVGEVKGATKANLDKLFDEYAINPHKLLNGKPKERVDYVLSMMPIEIDAELLKAKTGVTPPDDKHPLEAFDVVRSAIYEKRTKAHGVVDDLGGHVKQLETSIPADVHQDPSGDLARQREQLASLQTSLSQVDGNERLSLIEHTNSLDTSERSILTQLDQELADFTQRIQEKKDTIRKDFDSQRQNAKDIAASEFRDSRATLNRDIESAQTEIIKLEQRNKQFVENQSLRDMLASEVDRLATAQSEYEDLCETMKWLDAYKLTLTSTIPIPGLEVKDGDLQIDGIPWRHVNTARKISLCFELSALKDDGLTIALFDGLKALDEENMLLFLERAQDFPGQTFGTRATYGPLKIETYGELEAA